jgi:hypothetical protein
LSRCRRTFIRKGMGSEILGRKFKLVRQQKKSHLSPTYGTVTLPAQNVRIATVTHKYKLLTLHTKETDVRK